jgi:acetyl-CoA acyltransferase
MFNQGLGAELIARRWGQSREQLDAFSVGSHERAAAAIDAGRFEAQVVPVTTPDGTVVTTDEGVRRGGTVEGLGALKPAFRPDGMITAASSSQISDGAAAVLMTTSENAARLGLRPLARIHSTAVIGDDPVMMLSAPVPATERVLKRSGLSLDEIELYEVNEAFAPVPLAWLADTGADPDRLNVNGGAIALGHPVGASGARIMTTLVHQLLDSGARYGLQVMCEGGGLANATVVERI